MSIPRSLDGRKVLAAWPPGRPVRSGAGLCGLTLLLALASACGPVLAVTDDAAAQRERIGRERAAVERRAQAAQAACAQEFAVTACVDRVKAVRRGRLQQLDRERAVLDDELRKRRAAERVEQIEQRQAERAQEPLPMSVRTRSPAAGVAPKPAAHAASASAAAREAAASQSAALASERAAASARRAAQAEAHRIAVEKRNRDRATQHAPAPPLPQPPQAPASR